MDRMRWRYGDTNPVVAAVDPGTEIEIGDLVWQDRDDAKPASMLPCNHHIEPGHEDDDRRAWQQSFADKFLGVAMQGSTAGESDPIRVATTGVFEYGSLSETFELGDLVGADENGPGYALLDQQVAKVTGSERAVGRVAKRAPEPVTSVFVDIHSTVMAPCVRG
jgi:hypothetical protein